MAFSIFRRNDDDELKIIHTKASKDMVNEWLKNLGVTFRYKEMPKILKKAGVNGKLEVLRVSDNSIICQNNGRELEIILINKSDKSTHEVGLKEGILTNWYYVTITSDNNLLVIFCNRTLQNNSRELELYLSLYSYVGECIGERVKISFELNEHRIPLERLQRNSSKFEQYLIETKDDSAIAIYRKMVELIEISQIEETNIRSASITCEIGGKKDKLKIQRGMIQN